MWAIATVDMATDEETYYDSEKPFTGSGPALFFFSWADTTTFSDDDDDGFEMGGYVSVTFNKGAASGKYLTDAEGEAIWEEWFY